MNRNALAALSLGIFALTTAVLPARLSAQDGKMLNARDPLLRRAWLERVSRGQNLPTTVQSISAREAESYGIGEGDPATGDAHDTVAREAGGDDAGDGAFFRGKLSIQPYVVGWNGLANERWDGDKNANCADASLPDRLSLDDPVVLLGMDFGVGSLFGTVAIDFGTDSLARYAEKSGVTGFWKPLDVVSYWTFPEEGYLAWSDRHVTVVAGRLRAGIGAGAENVFLNGNARWYDQAQFAWWSDKMRFFSMLGTSSASLSASEYEIQSRTERDGDDASWGWDTVNNHDAATQAVVPLKLFTYHRVELKPLARLGVGISEMQLVGGTAPTLTNVLPTTIWHNTYTAGVSNVMMAADLWSVPLDGLLVWGEFVMDDSKAPDETKKAKPNCWAWELGTTWVIPARAGQWLFAASTEWSHADKWTYARWQPYLTMYQRQMLTGGHEGYDIPLGHSQGGDVDELRLSIEATAEDGKRAELSYSFIDKGPVYLGRSVKTPDWASGSRDLPDRLPVYYDYDDLVGIDGSLDELLGSTRKFTHALALDASWPFGKAWEANAGVDVRYVINAAHVEGRHAIETTYKAGLTWTYGK